MMKHLATNNFMGRRYTFYLSNYNLPNDSFFHYQLYSPGLTKNLDPVFSLKKLGERTKTGQSFDQERDILSFVLGGKEGIDQKGIEWLRGIVRNDDVQILNEGSKFPRIQMSYDRGVQKNVICSLRDSIRRKNYRFFPGRKVDVLWTPNELVVFEFRGDENMIWLEPVGVYKTTDYLMTEPLPVDLGTINCESLKWEKRKMSDIGQTLRRIEWNSFDNKFRFMK